MSATGRHSDVTRNRAARRRKHAVLVAVATWGLGGCMATAPKAVDSGSMAVGSAAGSTTEGANEQIERCTATLGTLRIDEQTHAGWYNVYASRYGTGSTVPALRLLVQQSNCFVIVDRDAAWRPATPSAR